MLEKYIRDDVFIEVNLGDIRNSNDLQYLISVFVKFNALHEELENVEKFLEFKEKLINSLEQYAIYIGMRIVDGWSEFYFYSKESKGIEQKVSSIFSGSGYTYETSISKDNKWNFYYENLFPSDLEMYLIYSKKIVLQMIGEGDNLTMPREVEHYVSFDTASQKERFIKSVKEIGFRYKDDIDSKELAHAIAIEKKHSLDQDTLRKVISELLEYVKKDHGRYELWSSTIVNE
jgi:hypothetical protein